ncbi:hypothetical protein BVC80_33g6 [Macleaya cordata]|uniref:Seed maturation protein n=1 Tax=Macleaya cordata TaxID=56857 RepID=A0A200QAK6_MACCD|nr:hypothetical protein BVC80_33g6 [Macleaya cordata]
MSGAQGAQPKGSFTATTYESVEGGQNKTQTDIRSKEDVGGIEVDKLQDKVDDAAGLGGPVFGAGVTSADDVDNENNMNKQDLGVTGTG